MAPSARPPSAVRRVAALVIWAVALLPISASAKGKATVAAEIGADGTFRSNGDLPAIPAIQQKVQETLQQTPILAANTMMQLPIVTDPRSMSLGSNRRLIYLTDGKLHNKKEVPWWRFWEDEPEAFPYGYLIKPDGSMARKLLFKGRTLQPYGIAESAEDARVAVTFYQGPQVEVWEGDLSLAWSYNEQSIHPSLPFFLPSSVSAALGYPAVGTLAVPFDIMDTLGDKDNGTVQCWVYSRDAGKRVELFRRRQFQGLNLPHSIAIQQLNPPTPFFDAKNRNGNSLPGPLQRFSLPGDEEHADQRGRPVMFALGLQEWIWEEGRGRGMWLVKPKWKEETSPVRLNLYALVNDKNAPEVVEETGERWRQDKGYRAPQPRSGSREIEPFVPKNGMRKIASYRFSGICKWPLMALVQGQETVKNDKDNTTSVVPVQFAVTGCYDGDWIEVLRLTDQQGRFIGRPAQFAEAKATAAEAAEASDKKDKSKDDKGKNKGKNASVSSAFVPLDEPFSVSYIRRPFGISQLGAIVADPATHGQTISFLDRGRKRIYTAPFPFPSGKHDTEEQLPAMTAAVAAAKEKPDDAKLAETAKKSSARARFPILRNGEAVPMVSAVIPLP